MSHTPGPWIWIINRETKRVELRSEAPGKYTVMDFDRYGMHSAAPRFLSDEHLMVRADELSANIEGEEHHASWHQTIDHDDARLIAAAPDLLAACKLALDSDDRAVKDVLRAVVKKAEEVEP